MGSFLAADIFLKCIIVLHKYIILLKIDKISYFCYQLLKYKHCSLMKCFKYTVLFHKCTIISLKINKIQDLSKHKLFLVTDIFLMHILVEVGFRSLIPPIGDFQNRQQVMLSRLVSRRSISPRDVTRRIGENAFYAKACSTLRETHQNTVLKITHHNSISTFNQTFSKLITKYLCFLQ